MKDNANIRRQKLLRELVRVNRQIAWTQKDMARIDSRIAALQVQTKAA